jgi:hypothetical protein
VKAWKKDNSSLTFSIFDEGYVVTNQEYSVTKHVDVNASLRDVIASPPKACPLERAGSFKLFTNEEYQHSFLIPMLFKMVGPDADFCKKQFSLLLTVCPALIKTTNEQGDTLLSLALKCKASTGVIKMILEAKASPVIADAEGILPLSRVSEQSCDQVKLLLEYKADPNQRMGVAGWTPLMRATCFGKKNLARQLLSVRADPSLRSEKFVMEYVGFSRNSPAFFPGGMNAQEIGYIANGEEQTIQHQLNTASFLAMKRSRASLVV